MKGELMRTYVRIDLDDHPEWPARAGAALDDLLRRDTHLFLVADDGDRAIGCISAQLELGIPGPTWPGVHASLADMWVEPAERRRGIARALVDQAVGWCREKGCGSVHLHSTPAAVAAYERLGFHIGVVKPGDTDFPVMWVDL